MCITVEGVWDLRPKEKLIKIVNASASKYAHHSMVNFERKKMILLYSMALQLKEWQKTSTTTLVNFEPGTSVNWLSNMSNL